MNNIPQARNYMRDVSTILIPGYGTIELQQWKNDVIYDSITVSSGSVTAGTESEFFSSLTNKNKDDTNLAEANQLPLGWEMFVMKMGAEVLPSANVTDIKTMMEQCYLRFETGNSKVRRRAPIYLWPIGFGLWEMRSVDEQSSSTTAGTLQIGSPAPATVPDLLLPIHLTPQLHFKTVLNITEAITLNADFRLRFYLEGYIRSPVS